MRPTVPHLYDTTTRDFSRYGCVYLYHKRLPGERGREVVVGLRTRHFREAEHRAALVDGIFDGGLARARETVSAGLVFDLNTVLWEYLAADRDFRLSAAPCRPVFGGSMDDEQDAFDTDLETLWHPSRNASEALARLWPIRERKRVKPMAWLKQARSSQAADFVSLFPELAKVELSGAYWQSIEAGRGQV